jgi:hypothetical protein
VKDLIGVRLVRVIGSYNFRRKHFCVSLKLDEFLNKNIPNEQRWNFYFYGSEELNILPFVEVEEEVSKNGYEKEVKIDIDIPPLVRKLLEKKKDFWDRTSGYWDRFVIITTLKGLGYSKEEVVKMLKENLTSSELHHSLKIEKQVEYIFKRDGTDRELFMPTVEWLMQMGYELTEEDRKFYKNFYFSWQDIFCE